MPRRSRTPDGRHAKLNVAVIGAGTAGLAAYRAAKAAGRTRAADRRRRARHDLRARRLHAEQAADRAAEAAHAVERFGAFGLRLDGAVTVDGRAVMARVRARARPLRRLRHAGRRGDSPRRQGRGYARFVDDTTLAVGDATIRARRGGDRHRLVAGVSRRLERRWAIAWSRTRRLRVERSAGKRRGVRARRHRARARPGAASARRARQGVRPRRRRRPALRSRGARVCAPRVRRRVLPRYRRARARSRATAIRWSCATARSTARLRDRALRLPARGHRPPPTCASSDSSTPRVALDAPRRAAVRPRDAAVRRARRSSSPATPATICRCCTKRPTRAASRATTPRAFPTCAPACAGHALGIVFTDPQIAVVGGGCARSARRTARHRRRLVRRPGPRARDAAQPRAPARLRGDRDRTACSAPR